jgi:hypothetical protein
MKKSTSQSAPARRSLSIYRNVVRRPVGEGGFSNPRVVIALLLCAATAFSVLTGGSLAFLRSDVPAQVSNRTLTFAERVAYQRAIEDVYLRHRIWPKERPDPKPSLDAVMSSAQLEKKVADYLRNSQALGITGNGRLVLSSCRLRWSAWPSTPNSPRSCANSLTRSATILLSLQSVWHGRCWRSVFFSLSKCRGKPTGKRAS